MSHDFTSPIRRIRLLNNQRSLIVVTQTDAYKADVVETKPKWSRINFAKYHDFDQCLDISSDGDILFYKEFYEDKYVKKSKSSEENRPPAKERKLLKTVTYLFDMDENLKHKSRNFSRVARSGGVSKNLILQAGQLLDELFPLRHDRAATSLGTWSTRGKQLPVFR